MGIILEKETALFKENAIGSAIDTASETATRYISEIGDDGIKVHAENRENYDSNLINGTGSYIYINGLLRAAYASEGIDLKSPDGASGFSISVGAGQSEQAFLTYLAKTITTSEKSYSISIIDNASNGDTVCVDCHFLVGVSTNPKATDKTYRFSFIKGTPNTAGISYTPEVSGTSYATVTVKYDGVKTFTVSKTTNYTAILICGGYLKIATVPSIKIADKILSDGEWYVESKKVLWEPSTISIPWYTSSKILSNDADLALCQYVQIDYRTTAGGNVASSIFPIDGTTHNLYVIARTTNVTGGRQVTITSTGLTFGHATYNTNQNDEYCVPIRIIGIRKV